MTVYINKGIRSSTGPGTRQQQNAGRQKKSCFLEIKERNTVKKFSLEFCFEIPGKIQIWAKDDRVTLWIGLSRTGMQS